MVRERHALSQSEIELIHRNILNGMYDDWDINNLFETIRIQRQVLRQLFNLFRTEPMRLVSTADPIRNSNLAHLKELVSMEDNR